MEALAKATTQEDFDFELSCLIEDYAEPPYKEDILQCTLNATLCCNWKSAKYCAIIYMAYYYHYDDKEISVESATEYLRSCSKFESGFSWAEFYDDMIRATKRQNRPFDPILKSIYYELRDGNQLTLIDSIQYPRTFNFALKLGADLDQVLYHIITDKKIKRVKKISLIEGLKRNSALTLSCGSDRPPAPILCIELGQNYLFKYFTDLEGIEEVVDLNGECLLTFLCRKCPFAKYFRYFNAKQYASMLIKASPNNSRGIDSLMALMTLAYNDTSNISKAIESLHSSGKLTIEEADNYLAKIGTETITQKITEIAKQKELERQRELERAHMAKLIKKLDNAGGSEIREEIWADSGSSFNLAHLPQEILEIIVEDLDYASIRSIFCTSKAMPEARSILRSNFYRNTMRRHFLPAYCTLLDSKEELDWSKEFYGRCRKVNSWKKGDFEREKLPLWSSASNFIEAMDENWIVTANFQSFESEGVQSASIRFYDLHNEKVIQRIYPHQVFVEGRCDFLESRPGELPTLISFDHATYKIIRPNEACMVSSTISNYVTVVDRTSAIFGTMPIKKDIETEKLICKSDIHIYSAKYNKNNKMTVALSNDKELIFMDEHLQERAKLKFKSLCEIDLQDPKLTWIDEFTVMIGQNFVLFDIRTMSKLCSLPYTVQYIGAGLGLGVTGGNEAQIWDFKRMELIRSTQLDPAYEMDNRFLCNSGHALFMNWYQIEQRSLWKFR